MRIAGFLLILIFSLAVALRPSDSTVYAPDYTEAGFRSIRVGMSRQHVMRTLGEPLSINPAPGYILWSCAPNGGKPEPSGDGGWVFPPRRSNFHADPAGTIVSVDGDFLDLDKDNFLGHPLRDAKARFGDPTEVYSALDRDLFFYSLIDAIAEVGDEDRADG